jgi:hypothetical protein
MKVVHTSEITPENAVLKIPYSQGGKHLFLSTYIPSLLYDSKYDQKRERAYHLDNPYVHQFTGFKP